MINGNKTKATQNTSTVKICPSPNCDIYYECLYLQTMYYYVYIYHMYIYLMYVHINTFKEDCISKSFHCHFLSFFRFEFCWSPSLAANFELSIRIQPTSSLSLKINTNMFFRKNFIRGFIQTMIRCPINNFILVPFRNFIFVSLDTFRLNVFQYKRMFTFINWVREIKSTKETFISVVLFPKSNRFQI